MELVTELAKEKITRIKTQYESEILLRDLFNSLPQIVYEVDKQGNIAYINDAGMQVFGYSPNDILQGLEFGDFIVESEHKRAKRRLARVLSGKPPEQEEYCFRCKDGSTFTALISSRLRVVNGEVCGSRGIIFDISSLKQTENELRSSEQHYRALFEGANDAILILENKRISQCNNQAMQFFQRSREELIGTLLSDLVQGTDQHPENDSLTQALDNPGRRKSDSSRHEWIFPLPDGNKLEGEVTLSHFQTPTQQLTQVILRDITEQNRNRRDLEERDALWQAVFERAPFGITINRLSDGVYLAVNPTHEKITGLKSDEIIGKPWFDIIPTDQPLDLEASTEELLRTGRFDNHELHLRKEDGTEIDVLNSATLFHAGEEPCVATCLIDITDRKKLSQEIAQSEAKLSSLFQAVPIGLVIVKDRNFLSVNDAFCRITGYTREELVNRDSSRLYYDDGVFERVGKDLYGQLLQQGTSFTETHFLRKDGSRRYVSLSAAPLLPDHPEEGVAVAVKDITERRKMTQALRENEFRFRSFFNTNPLGILLIDFHGAIMDINKAFSRESGYALEELQGQHYISFVAADDGDAVLASFERLKSGLKKGSPLTFSYRTKQGAYIPVRAESWLITDEKSIPLYIGVFIRNIELELKLAEEKSSLEKQIVHAQKSEAIGTLAGGIAHDFNNILGGMVGYVELALNREPFVLDDKMRQYLNNVLLGGKRAKSLVQQILRFSRNSSMTMEPVHLTPVIKESLNLLRSTLPTTIEIQHHINLESDTILGDQTQIHQIIMNLATNAYHAMRENGGILTVEMQNVVLKGVRRFQSVAIPAGEYLCLSVKDTGTGMSSDMISRIFEPYFTTKSVDEGSGLGLAVVLGIVKSHKGLIEVESKPGEGCRFIVHLPLFRGEATNSSREDRPLAIGHGEHLLVVDDESYFLEVVEESLKTLGYRVTATKSSRRALKLFQADPHNYQLLLTDQTMPQMTGVQLIEQVHAVDPAFPVILCTGYSETVTQESARYYNINKFLMKPVSVDELATAISDLLVE